MKTRLLVLVCALVTGCTQWENGSDSPSDDSLELAPEPASSPSSPDGSGQPPPGHGGPNPGWGGALPPGWGHLTPPGHLGEEGTPTWKHKDAPKIISYSQSRTRVQPGDTVAFQLVATDPNGLALTYTWSATQGYLNERTSPVGTEVVWTAPFINSLVMVTVRVENTRGLPATKTFRVQAEADLTTAVFVSPSGSDSNSGSTSSPYATVQRAIDAAAAGGEAHVVLAAGTYREAIQLPSNLSLWGQYDPATWNHVPANESILASPTNVGIFVSDAVRTSFDAAWDRRVQPQCVYNFLGSGSIQGLVIASSNASVEQSSLAVLLNNVSGTFTVQNNILQGGMGGNGIAAIRDGRDACGGHGGGWGSAGGRGCDADTGASGGNPGRGGATWGEWGQGGEDGTDGTDGIVPANQDLGQLSGSACGGPPSFNWQALGGTGGLGGSGGGGGGGGAIGLCCLPTWPPRCSAWPAGGGGRGGVGGRSSKGGSGAGGSFGVVILDSPGSVVIQNNFIRTAGGGTGGESDSVYPGTPGEAGGPGAFCFAGSGGNGGNGGRGGNGGGGAGGGGGMSVGILRHNSSNLDVGIPDSNTYNVAPRGAGGTGSRPALAGMPGIQGNTFVMP